MTRWPRSIRSGGHSSRGTNVIILRRRPGTNLYLPLNPRNSLITYPALVIDRRRPLTQTFLHVHSRMSRTAARGFLKNMKASSRASLETSHVERGASLCVKSRLQSTTREYQHLWHVEDNKYRTTELGLRMVGSHENILLGQVSFLHFS